MIRLGEVSTMRALKAILSVMPLDSFLEHPLERMEVNEDPSITTEVQDKVLEFARVSENRPDLEFGIIKRLDFYKRAKNTVAVVHCLDDLPYGCFVLHKGVIFSN